MMRSWLPSDCVWRIRRRDFLCFLGMLAILLLSGPGYAGDVVLRAPPAPDANCVVTAMNRSAPLQSDYSFTLFNLPSVSVQPFRVRATCSDGTVGETEIAFPLVGDLVTYAGDIFWRPATPIPVGVLLSLDSVRLLPGAATQFTVNGISAQGATFDLTPRIKGTQYSSSNPQLAAVSENGLVTISTALTSSASGRVVMTAQNEGVAGSQVLVLGPQGTLTGRVVQVDGNTPVAGAQVSVVRNSPREVVATVLTDSSGNYSIEDVSAGSFSVSVFDPYTGDRGRGAGAIASDGETSAINIRLNGQGVVTVNVIDGAGSPVANALVSFISLSGFNDSRQLLTDANGRVVFDSAPAGDFVISARDSATGLLRGGSGALTAGSGVSLTVRLQPVGALVGAVYGSDGATVQAGVQVRLLSAAQGLVSQLVTGEDGRFRFDTLPLADGPYTLDAMQNGRLRTRVSGLVLLGAGTELTQDLVFGPVGKVTGQVTTGDGALAQDVIVTVQSQVGQQFTFTAKTDSQGRYAVDGISVGAFTVTAVGSAGETGSGSGTIGTDGETVTTNLQMAANGIVGTVFARDGVTPVGAGISVTLTPGNRSIQTNARGQFGFTVTTPATYIIEAADGEGNRGRTQVVLTSIDPSDPTTVNVVFLGQGSVSGLVRDPGGAPQANLAVRLTSQSVFGGQLTTTTDAQGQFSFEGVYVGDFSLYSRNEATQLAGFALGRVVRDGEDVAADVILAATGSVTGRVFLSDGSTPLAAGKVELLVNGKVLATTQTNSLGAYTFPAVPLGDFTLRVTDPVTGDKGQAISSVSALNEVRTVNVRLLGQGTVRVLVVDSHNAPIEGAAVELTSRSAFGGSITQLSDAAGVVLLQPVFNGDFILEGSKGTGSSRFAGSASGTVVNGANTDVTLPLTNTPIYYGAIRGVLTKGLEALPQAGVTVTLVRNDTEVLLQSQVSGADGSFVFTKAQTGITYRLSAVVNGRVRSRSLITLSADGEEIVQNLVLLGAGTVSGLTVDTQNRPLAGTRVALTHPDPVYGGFFVTTSQADGRYSFSDIPAGNFTLRARSNGSILQAQDSGIIRFDGDAVSIDLSLVDSSVAMPRTLYDANGMQYDVRGDGSLISGTQGVFVGNGNADARGTRLELLVGGVPVPFQNGDGSVGRLTQKGQLLEVDELNPASGLNVIRRVYVPKTGYFARYLEVLENRTSDPITVGVRVTSNIAPGRQGARVVDSSTGDAVLSVSDSLGRDQWVVADDDLDADPFETTNNPSVALVFDGESAADRASDAQLAAIGTTAKVRWDWTNITVQPGTSVALMHFAVQQTRRVSAREAARRLVQLPPEALEGLTAEERGMIRNFAVPSDGVSPLASLPPVDTGSVNGIVYAGDGATVIPNASVRLQSTHSLFARIYQATADSQGRFSFQAEDSGGAAVVAVPLDRFTLKSTHPITTENSLAASGQFADGQSAAVQDVIFSGTANLRGVVKRHNGALVTDGFVIIDYRFPDDQVRKLSTPISSNGGYQFYGIAPAAYLPRASMPHPQGQPVLGMVDAPVALASDSTSVVDIVMESTGEITGLVRAANGEPVVNALVRLASIPDYRTTNTDTGGIYRFIDVRTGSHTVSASDGRFSATVPATVTTDVASTVELQFTGSAQVAVQVNFQRGAAAGGTSVIVKKGIAVLQSAQTNSVGQVSFTLPIGHTYTFEVAHPDSYELKTKATLALTGTEDVVGLTLTLPAAANVVGTLYRPDRTTLAGGISVLIRRQDGTTWSRSATTDALGQFRILGLPLTRYTVSAEDVVNLKFADAELTLTTDGQEASTNLYLADNRISMPAITYDANGFRYDIQGNGVIARGFGGRGNADLQAFNNGGAILEVSGQAFVGNGSAYLEAERRQYVLTQSTPMAGLNVTRKVFVPKGAYFARYLEIFDNPNTAPVTVSVKIKNKFSYGRQLLATSSGDSVVQASGADRDIWHVVGGTWDTDPFQSGRQPPVAQVLGQPGAPILPDMLSLTTNVLMESGWSTVTVPAGGRVSLMHFEVQQINPAGARASAERLSQLPPEAIQSLRPSEIASVVNFNVPADGQSSVPALPSLLGSIAGRVYEGDGVTVVPNTKVTVQSEHPLFNRTWTPVAYCGSPNNMTATLISGVNGNYALSGALKDPISIPLPVGVPIRVKSEDYPCTNNSDVDRQYRGHPITKVPAPTVTATFADGATAINQDLEFQTGIMRGTITGPLDYSVTGGTVYASIAAQNDVSVSVQANGNYLLPGMPAGTHSLTVSASHPQGTALNGVSSPTAVAVGMTAWADIALEATGGITGSVSTANGAVAVNQRIDIAGTSGGRNVTRTTYTDSLGHYSFSAVPVGNYSMTVTDSRTGAQTTASVVIGTNQTSTQNLILPGAGVVQLTVNYARGVAASGVAVSLQSSAVGSSYKSVGTTDAQGRINIFVPVGNYDVRVRHPLDSSGPTKSLSGTISVNNETIAQTLALPALASINVRVVNHDAADAPIANAEVRLTDSYLNDSYIGTTNSSGIRLVGKVHEGAYTLKVWVPSLGKRVVVTGIVDASVDGQAIEKLVQISSAQSKFGVFSFVGERHLYSIPANPGDVVSVLVNGVAVGSTPASYTVKAQAYDSSRQLQASGYGYGPSNNYSQYNDYLDLQNVRANDGGNYTVAVAPYYSSSSYLGGYRLDVAVNGAVVDVRPYLDGGLVQGIVLRGDGVTAVANQLVEISSQDVTLGLRVRTRTDAEGRFQFGGVPLGDFRLVAIDEATNREVAVTTGGVATAGEVVTRNLRLPSQTTLSVTVNVTGIEVPSSIDLQLTDANGTHSVGPATFISGQSTSQPLTLVAYGETIRVQAVHPDNSNITAESSVVAADGQTVPVSLTLAPASLQGTLRYPDGTAAAEAYVKVVRASDGAYLAATYVDSQGRYVFDALPVNEDILLQVWHPQTGVRIQQTVMLQSGQALTQDMQLPGVGTVSGMVLRSNGTPVANAQVSVSYSVHDTSGQLSTQSRNAMTDADGRYSVAPLPVSQPLDITATYNNGFQSAQASSEVTLAVDGETRSLDLTLDLVGGTLTVSAMTGDGQPVPGICEFGIESPVHANTVFGECGGALVQDLPAGDYAITAYGMPYNLGTINVTIAADQQATAIIPVSKVSGTVRYADGRLTPNPSVYLQTASGVFHAYTTDTQGHFVVYGAPVGDLTVHAQDNGSGLTGEAVGGLAEIAVPLSLDVALQSAGTVTGVVRNRDNTVVANAQVYVRSSALSLDRYTTTDGNGIYRVENVAVGDISVLARDPASVLVSVANGRLESNGLVLALDVSAPMTGSLSGQVLNIDNVTPVPSAPVSLTTAQSYGPFGAITLQTTADSSGQYRFDLAPTGTVNLVTSSGNLFGKGSVEVVTGGNTSFNITLGGAVRLPYTLNGADTSLYDAQCTGSLSDGGYKGATDAYDGAYLLKIDGSPFPCTSIADMQQNARELLLSGWVIRGLQVSRHVYVPQAGGYARFLEVLSNPSDVAITVPVSITGNLGSDGGTQVRVAASATGNRYVVTSDSGSDPSLAHVFASSGAVLATTTQFSPPSDTFNYSWSVTVPARGTVSLLHFAVQRTKGIWSEAQTQAEALANMTQPGMFDGLSAAEKSIIQNFAVSP